MLASSTKVPPAEAISRFDDSWWYEPKFDGIRAVLRPLAGQIMITNRRGRDVTFRYPDVVAAWAGLLPGTLDGEIICLGEDGTPDFARIHRRDAQQTVSGSRRIAAMFAAVFIPFDILDLAGADTRALPYVRRHELLLEHVGAERVALASQDGAAMWSVVLEKGLEGLIAKRAGSRYISGRSASWVKLKATKRINVLGGGYTPRTGSSGGVGALDIFLWDPGTSALVSVGRVGSGLRATDTRDVVAGLERGDPVVVEVEYLELSASGQLRMPVFKKIARTVPPEACVTNTLK